MRICSIELCGRIKSAKGFCAKHYVMYRKWGRSGMLTKHHSYASKGMVRRHDMSEYLCWAGMKKRCDNKNDKSYVNYGGRGIKYEERWKQFENFYEDMGKKPIGTSLERLDNEKGYQKDNCKWATLYEQSRNKRNNVKVNGALLSDMLQSRGIVVSTFYSKAKKLRVKPERLWVEQYGE
jgi:hypothetical protein